MYVCSVVYLQERAMIQTGDARTTRLILLRIALPGLCFIELLATFFISKYVRISID